MFAWTKPPMLPTTAASIDGTNRAGRARRAARLLRLIPRIRGDGN